MPHITLRSPEMEQKYQEYLLKPEAKECCFCREIKKHKAKEKSEIIHYWDRWAMMNNEYMYDKIYEKHVLLFPLRHVDYSDLTVAEIRDYDRILSKFEHGYHQFIRNLGNRQSQKGHFHVHLCRFL